MSAYLPVLAYFGLWLLFGVCAGLLRRALAGPAQPPPAPASIVPSDCDDSGSGAQWLSLAWIGLAVAGAAMLLLLWASRVRADEGSAAILPGLILFLAIVVALLHVARRGALPDTGDGP